MNPNLGKKSIALALSLSLAVVVSGAYVAQAKTMPSATSQAAAAVSEVTLGFNAAFGDIPARLAAKVDNARINARAKSRNVVAYMSPDVSSVREAVEKMFTFQPTPSPIIAQRVSAKDSVPGKNHIRAGAGLAAVAEAGLSVGEQAAMDIYDAINNFFSFVDRSVTNFFATAPTPTPPAVVETEPPAQSTTVAPASPPRTSTGESTVTNSTPLITSNVTRVSNSYPTYTTVVQGVSSESLAALRTELLASIANSIRPVAAQNVTNAQTIQMVAKIQDISDVIIRSGDIRNSIFDNGVRVSAAGGNFTTLTGGTTSLGATTITGALSITGAPSFTGHTTLSSASTTLFSSLGPAYFGATATSTFDSAGALALASALAVGSGGTGWGNIAANTLLTGNGTSALATTTVGNGLSLSGSVLSTSFGTTTANTWTALQQLYGSASSTVLSAHQAYFGATATSTFNSAGDLLVVGSTTLRNFTATNATTTTLFSTTASSTNLFAQTASLSTLTLENALSVSGGGTGLSTVADGSLLFGSGGTALTALATTSAAGRFLTLDYTTGRPSWVATSSLNVALSNTTGTLTVASGGTGQSTFTSSQLLYGNGTAALSGVATTSFAITSGLGLSYSGTLGALVGGTGGTLSIATSSLYTGTTGQFPYFSDTNALTATSSIFLASSGNVGIGTTTPLSLLAVAGSASIGADYNIAGPTNGLIVQGNVGIGTTTPWLGLSVTNASASGQFVASYDQTNYSTLAVDATGDLKFKTVGGDIRALTENLWICDNSACPTLTATSTAGNVFIENAVTFGNGFSMASTSNNAASELGLYNASGDIMIIFDNEP